MIFFLFMFFLSFFQSNVEPNYSIATRQILENKMPWYDKRYGTFAISLDLIKDRKAKVLVETGTARDGINNYIGDGGSTAIFADWLKNNEGELYSVDISAENLAGAANGINDTTGKVHFIQNDSVVFLQEFNRPIDFLYLDSFDFNFSNPGPSQQHHLKEIIAAYPLLTKDCVVMVDDSDRYMPGGGKGKLVIDYLTERGWKVIAHSYQVILSRN